MHSRLATLLAVLLAISVARGAAAEPTVVAPDGPVPIGGFADVLIQGLDRPDTLVWAAYPTEPVRVTSAWGTSDPILSVPTHKARRVALFVAWQEGERIRHEIIELVVGQPGPGPGPEPDPDPEPDPPPPPGVRKVLLIHETADSDHEFAQLTTLLRQPPYAQVLQDRLAIIDDDEPVLAGWLAHLRGMQMPVLVIYDEASKAIVHKEELHIGTTPEQVMEAIDAHD